MDGISSPEMADDTLFHSDVDDDIASDNEQPTNAEADLASVWDSSLEQGRLQISQLIVKFRKASLFPDRTDPQEVLDRYTGSVRAFLYYLEHTATITPTVKAEVGEHLKIFQPPNHPYVPRDIRDKAVELFDRFEAENWGENEPEESEDDDASLAVTGAPTAPSAPAAPTAAPQQPGVVTAEIRVPPRNHRIWGINGIMYGIARQVRNGRVTSIVDPRYAIAKRPANVIGHNNLTPGAWWPTQLSAHFHGAHGHNVRGISGSADEGTFSIVISGRSTYSDMDQDTGTEVWYSADNSRRSTSRTSLPAESLGTRSLRRSLANGRPVRVIRSAGHGAGARHHWAPAVGCRYDGLYMVIEVRDCRNTNGGLYAQFRLRREQNQPGPSLATLRDTVPSPQQLAEYKRIAAGY